MVKGKTRRALPADTASEKAEEEMEASEANDLGEDELEDDEEEVEKAESKVAASKKFVLNLPFLTKILIAL